MICFIVIQMFIEWHLIILIQRAASEICEPPNGDVICSLLSIAEIEYTTITYNIDVIY